MAKRSKGIKRIVFMISILSGIGWILFIAIMGGFTPMTYVDPSEVPQADAATAAKALLAPVAVFCVGYFIPQLICRVVYWVIDGFRKDGET